MYNGVDINLFNMRDLNEIFDENVLLQVNKNLTIISTTPLVRRSFKIRQSLVKITVLPHRAVNISMAKRTHILSPT